MGYSVMVKELMNLKEDNGVMAKELMNLKEYILIPRTHCFYFHTRTRRALPHRFSEFDTFWRVDANGNVSDS